MIGVVVGASRPPIIQINLFVYPRGIDTFTIKVAHESGLDLAKIFFLSRAKLPSSDHRSVAAFGTWIDAVEATEIANAMILK